MRIGLVGKIEHRMAKDDYCNNFGYQRQKILENVNKLKDTIFLKKEDFSRATYWILGMYYGKR